MPTLEEVLATPLPRPRCPPRRQPSWMAAAARADALEAERLDDPAA